MALSRLKKKPGSALFVPPPSTPTLTEKLERLLRERKLNHLLLTDPRLAAHLELLVDVYLEADGGAQ